MTSEIPENSENSENSNDKNGSSTPNGWDTEHSVETYGIEAFSGDEGSTINFGK